MFCSLCEQVADLVSRMTVSHYGKPDAGQDEVYSNIEIMIKHQEQFNSPFSPGWLILLQNV